VPASSNIIPTYLRELRSRDLPARPACYRLKEELTGGQYGRFFVAKSASAPCVQGSVVSDDDGLAIMRADDPGTRKPLQTKGKRHWIRGYGGAAEAAAANELLGTMARSGTPLVEDGSRDLRGGGRRPRTAASGFCQQEEIDNLLGFPCRAKPVNSTTSGIRDIIDPGDGVLRGSRCSKSCYDLVTDDDTSCATSLRTTAKGLARSHHLGAVRRYMNSIQLPRCCACSRRWQWGKISAGDGGFEP